MSDQAAKPVWQTLPFINAEPLLPTDILSGLSNSDSTCSKVYQAAKNSYDQMFYLMGVIVVSEECGKYTFVKVDPLAPDLMPLKKEMEERAQDLQKKSVGNWKDVAKARMSESQNYPPGYRRYPKQK